MTSLRSSAHYAGGTASRASAMAKDAGLTKPGDAPTPDRRPGLITGPADKRDPLLVGAAQIARYLSPPAGIGPPMTAKQVYKMREAGVPIGKVPGLGIAVRASTLDAYLRDHGA